MKEQVLFNEGWLFHLGDIDVPDAKSKSPMYIQAKTERKRYGPAAREYIDSPEYRETGLITHEEWYPVNLPHEYIINQRPEANNNNTLGFFSYKNAWYRKRFRLEKEDKGRRICLYFEGVAIHCKVYVNGCYMLTNNCGYTSFEVDITDVVDFEATNTIAIFIDTTEHEGWWYEGAGIYRPVWLIKYEPVSVDLYGVFVAPYKLEKDAWNIPIKTTLRNDSYDPIMAKVHSIIYDSKGHRVDSVESKLLLSARDKTEVVQSIQTNNPDIWDIDHPTLYTIETSIFVENDLVDKQGNRFGFRTFRFDPDGGFYLNGRNVKIKGVCCHQDYGLTGKAVPKRVQRYRLELLKEMGANGYRAAHYPHHAYTMDMLDELGFLVMAETRWYESTPEGLEQLEMLVKRDRNRPSVILWSAGNEEPLHLTDAGRRIMRALTHRIRQLDGTRPVTTAVSHSPSKSTVKDLVDVMGINYNLQDFDILHAELPNTPLLSSECCATSTTRGWYFADCPERGYIYGYDRDTNKSFLAREKTWKFIMERPWLAGGYQWAGIEHRGETVWPRLCSQAGAIDLFLNRKDAFYQNKSHWTEAPMVHLLPHWNWFGLEGENIRVVAYTNCDAVSLFLNDQELGRQEVEPFGHAEWFIPYKPGRLVAKGYRNRELVCEQVIETTGDPVALRLRLESNHVQADGEDVAIVTCDCIDSQGRHVPDASPMVQFFCNEKGSILGTGSDVCDHEPVTCHDRKMRAGLISLIARAGKEKGQLVLLAKAEGLEPGKLVIELE